VSIATAVIVNAAQLAQHNRPKLQRHSAGS